MNTNNSTPSGSAMDKPNSTDKTSIEIYPDTFFSKLIDACIKSIGEFASFIWVTLVAVIILNVVLRYTFGRGFIEFEEIQWHMYAVGFLIGLSYCFKDDSHIRVDIFFDHFSLRKKAWIELFGTLFFLLPFVIAILYFSLSFIAYSWNVNETSDAPSGLPFRWAIKSFIFIGFFLLGMASLARLSRISALLFNYPKKLK